MAAEDGPDLALRPATGADLPEIAELYYAARMAAVPAMPALVHTREEVIAHVRGWKVDAPAEREVWLAEDDLELIGYAVVTGGWLDALYVDPGRQGSGIGSTLLDLVKSRRPRGFGLGSSPATCRHAPSTCVMA